MRRPSRLVEGAIAGLDAIILGKQPQLRLCLACLLARGHLLIEDIPGVGKTTLAHALARTLGLSYQRIQFTSDLLPADIIGVSVFEPEQRPASASTAARSSRSWCSPTRSTAPRPRRRARCSRRWRNTRSPPTARRIRCSEPFFVIATQNPLYQIGTFPLPESQLDRFLMRIELGYPDAALERQLLLGRDRRDLLATLEPALTPQQLLQLQGAVPRVHASEALLDYVQAIARYTRQSADFEAGLSPRAVIALLRAAQAWALMHGHPRRVAGGRAGRAGRRDGPPPRATRRVAVPRRGAGRPARAGSRPGPLTRDGPLQESPAFGPRGARAGMDPPPPGS